jgi:PilZ domain
MRKRTEPRVQRALSVRVLGMDSNGRAILETARTVNVSRSGVMVEGLASALTPGDVVSLKYEDRKARFRVVWAAKPGTPQQGQIGLEQVQPGDDLWQLGRVGQEPCGTERRRQPRFETSLPVEVRSAQGAPIRAQLSDISLGGIYVNTLVPLPVHAGVTVLIWLGDHKLMLNGKVRTSVPGVGCGIEFGDLSAEDSSRLTEYLNTCTPAEDKRTAETTAPDEPATEAAAAQISLQNRV